MKPLIALTITLAALCAAAVNGQECKRNGFFRNPDDCTRFYRCVDLTGAGYFQKYTFSCPAGTVFDESISVCNWPWASAPCEESEPEETTTEGGVVEVPGDTETEAPDECSAYLRFRDQTVIVTPQFDFVCRNNGIFPHDSDCARFWLCRQCSPELYKCPAGYLFKDEARRCVKEEEAQCTKTPDLVRLQYEPIPITLRVNELDSFFARYSRY